MLGWGDCAVTGAGSQAVRHFAAVCVHLSDQFLYLSHRPGTCSYSRLASWRPACSPSTSPCLSTLSKNGTAFGIA